MKNCRRDVKERAPGRAGGEAIPTVAEMISSFAETFTADAPRGASLARPIIIVTGFVAAWLVARASAFVAGRLLAWHDRRHGDAAGPATRADRVKRRETSVSVVRTAVTYVAVVAATVLAVAQLAGGLSRVTAIAGASFALVIAGFAAQRFLVDLIAGLTMFLERWYSVGDTVFVPGLDLQGVVEEVSLRSTKLRTLNGEEIRIHNSQIPAVRVRPLGVNELSVEFFVSEEERGRRLVEGVSALMPEGATAFVRRPDVDEVQQLAEALFRMRVRATVAPGREWLVENFLPSLLHEKAGDGLILHGPVVLPVDEGATRSFARAARPFQSARVA